MIHFSAQLFSDLVGPGAGAQPLVAKDLARIRIWGPRVLEVLEGGTARFWRDQALGALFAGSASAVGYFVLEWSLGTLFVFWFFDLFAVWLGDVIKAHLAPAQLELELADAERSFEITQLVQALRRSRTRPAARPPRVAPERLNPKFSIPAMLGMPVYVLVFLGVSAGVAALLDIVSISWWTVALVSGAFVLHLCIALRDWRVSRDKETAQPQLLALSYFPATVFAATITIFIWTLLAALLVEEIVPWDLATHSAKGFVGIYAGTAVGLFYCLRRVSRHQIRDLRYYLSKSDAWQDAELKIMRQA